MTSSLLSSWLGEAGHDRSLGSLTIAEQVEQAARRSPERVALDDGTGALTFGNLNQRCDRVAAMLQGAGIGRGDRVLIVAEKRCWPALAALAVCRAGATFVLVDGAAPTKRLQFYVADCRPAAVIGPHRLRELAGPEQHYWEPQDLMSLSEGCAGPNLTKIQPGPHDIAYVIYTSGSTGQPKGVEITHHNLRGFLAAHNRRAGIGPGDRCMNTGPYHFDISLMEIFLPLTVGATVFITSATPMPTRLLSTLERQRVTHFYAVGTVLGILTGDGTRLDKYDLSSLKMLQTGAEVCNGRVVNQWLSRLPGLHFINSYGPTEATVGCISFEHHAAGLLPEDDVPIGMPHDGTRIVLRGADGCLLDTTGTVGELLVGGDQVMAGYLNRPLENRRAFVSVGGERFYRTGDHAVRDESGNYHFVGRRDHEVKICGQRIHLNELRHVGLTFDRASAVEVGMVPDRSGTARLACFAVASRADAADIVAGLRAHYGERLPRALVPQVWAVGAKVPSTATGKADVGAVMEALTVAVAQHGVGAFLISNAVAIPLSRADVEARAGIPVSSSGRAGGRRRRAWSSEVADVCLAY